MSNRDLFNQKEFPEWKVHDELTEKQVEFVKKFFDNNTNLMA